MDQSPRKYFGRGTEELRSRTKRFALNVIALCANLPKRPDATVIGKQLLRSGTSVGAHYREASRAKSDADFISKIEGAMQELDESDYWLELLFEAKIIEAGLVNPILSESDELMRIFLTIVSKVKHNLNSAK